MSDPVIAFLGPSRVGKDTCADMFSMATGVPRCPSCSSFILPFAAARLGLSPSAAWEVRHNWFGLWRQIGDDLRRDDPCRLVRWSLAAGGRIVVGVRSRGELEAAKREGLIQTAVWVFDPDGKPDPTLEFGPDVCDVILSNPRTPKPKEGVMAAMEELRDRLGWPDLSHEPCDSIPVVRGNQSWNKYP